MPDTASAGLFPDHPIPPAPPVACPQDRIELLWRLRARRRELVDDLAVGLGSAELLAPSSVEPLAVLQTAIAAVEAELGADDPDRPPAAA